MEDVVSGGSYCSHFDMAVHSIAAYWLPGGESLLWRRLVAGICFIGLEKDQSGGKSCPIQLGQDAVLWRGDA
jgi:hypothetical protein